MAVLLAKLFWGGGGGGGRGQDKVQVNKANTQPS